MLTGWAQFWLTRARLSPRVLRLLCLGDSLEDLGSDQCGHDKTGSNN